MIVENILNSFKNNDDGYSGRKMSAFWSIVIVATGLSAALAILVMMGKAEVRYLIYVIFAWLSFGSVCLGLVTIPELIKFIVTLKNGPKKDETG